MDVVIGNINATISNGGQTLNCWNAATFQWGTMTTDVYDKDYTAGGKFIIEITVDSYAAGQFICPGLWEPAQNVSSTYGGNKDGFGFLGTNSLTRVYHGPEDSEYDNVTPQTAMATGVVVTMAINLDDDEVTVYIDGTATTTTGIVRTTPTSNYLRPVIKGYKDCVMTINPTILHPVTGFVAWA